MSDELKRLIEAYRLGEFELEGGSPTVEALSVKAVDNWGQDEESSDSFAAGYQQAIYELRDLFALLAQPSDGALTNEGAEPVALTAVAVLRDDGDGGLEPDWLLEGGTAELFEGMTLLVADDAPELCLKDGHADLYRRPPAPASVVLPERQRDSCEDSDVFDDAYAEGWNACLDRVKELNS